MQGFLSSIPSQGTKIPHATVQKKMCDLWEEVKNVNMNKSLKEVDSNLQEWLQRVQDFRGGSSYRCGGNSKRSRINSGTWRCDWNSTISWYNYNKWGVASYGWWHGSLAGYSPWGHKMSYTTERLTLSLSLKYDIKNPRPLCFRIIVKHALSPYCFIASGKNNY